MKILLTCLCLGLTGCAFFRSKPTQELVTNVHNLRLGVEGIPGIVPLVDTYAPWAPAARLGLNELYGLDQLAVKMAQDFPITPTAGTK